MRRFDGAAPWAQPAPAAQGVLQLPPGAVVTSEAPARPASFAADVGVPVLQAAVTGGLVAGLVTFGAARLWEVRGWDLLTLWGGAALAISTVAWLLLLVEHRRLLWQLERWINRDLDGDRKVGDPSKQRLEVHVKAGAYTRFVGSDWLGIEDDRLLTFAAGIHRGRGLTEGDWGKDTAVFPKGINQWRAFRAKLLEAGLIAPLSGAANSTYTWTAAGRAFINRLLAYAKSGE